MNIAQAVNDLRTYFNTGSTRSYEWRVGQLDAVVRLVEENEEALMKALMEDSGKADFTAYSGDVMFVRGEALHAKKHLKKWMKPRKVGAPLMLKPAKSYIQPEPLGVALVIGAWNFPLHLTLGPLCGAIAAGNTCMVKPSEISPKVSALIAALVPQYLDGRAVKVVEGGVTETTVLLEQRFDKILYTGNSQVAKVVAAAAAKHLTPVTLELGGKNPCIVHADANLDVAANRIIDVKCSNAGQICVSADYLLVHESVYDAFLPKLTARIRDFFGEDPQQSSDYSRIINARHLARLQALMGEGTVYHGGRVDERDNYLEPTILVDVPETAKIMQEEIFGPILPVFKYADLQEALAKINAREKPLALYVFTESDAVHDAVEKETSSGALIRNVLMMHASNHQLPFGGVGNSGMGSYHGQYSFDNMSHLKSVMIKPTWMDPRGAYPPFDEKAMTMRKKITRWMMS